MKTEQLLSNLHLHLGLTRAELRRRLELGLIDPQILKLQINDYSNELKLEALCTQWLETHSEDQVDKSKDLE